MTAAAKLQVTFWGVRGSIPTADAGVMRYGGNTSCLEVRYGSQPPLILDAGSGARRLGQSWLNSPEGLPAETHVLFTHFHWDHIQGLPFFAPLYSDNSVVKFYSPVAADQLRFILEDQMRAPYFPVSLPSAQARAQYGCVESGGIQEGDLVIKPIPLHHPGGATGYRIESPAGSIVYATDHEHGYGASDLALLEHCSGADLLVYDAQYTPEEYRSRCGWGHSTWQAGIRTASEAGVRRLVLFHHDPDRDDKSVDEIQERAMKHFPNTEAAREGCTISV